MTRRTREPQGVGNGRGREIQKVSGKERERREFGSQERMAAGNHNLGLASEALAAVLSIGIYPEVSLEAPAPSRSSSLPEDSPIAALLTDSLSGLLSNHWQHPKQHILVKGAIQYPAESSCLFLCWYLCQTPTGGGRTGVWQTEAFNTKATIEDHPLKQILCFSHWACMLKQHCLWATEHTCFSVCKLPQT